MTASIHLFRDLKELASCIDKVVGKPGPYFLDTHIAKHHFEVKGVKEKFNIGTQGSIITCKDFENAFVLFQLAGLFM
jgi:hypothetical protein